MEGANYFFLWRNKQRTLVTLNRFYWCLMERSFVSRWHIMLMQAQTQTRAHPHTQHTADSLSFGHGKQKMHIYWWQNNEQKPFTCTPSITSIVGPGNWSFMTITFRLNPSAVMTSLSFTNWPTISGYASFVLSGNTIFNYHTFIIMFYHT